MKKQLLKRINIANEYIKFAIDNDTEEYRDSFGSGWPTIMKFEKKIRISPKGQIVTVYWLDGYDLRESVQKYNTNNEESIMELRYTINGIIRAVRRVKKSIKK